jgi:hypothetical protein
MGRNDARAIEWDCAQLLTRFFNDFDQWRYGAMADAFAPDGVWHRMGKASQGRAAVLETLNARSTTQAVRHVVTNIQVDVKDDRAADFLLYITAYQHDTGTKPAATPKIRGPSLVLSVPGRLVRTGDDGWKIAEMSMNRAFEFEK